MARIRTIKPEFWTDEKIVECSIAARLLFIGSLNFADDYGNLDSSPRRLKMQVFPADNIEVEKLISELKTHGILTEYSSGNKKYLHINGFQKHQRINRPSKPVHPLPDFDINEDALIEHSPTEKEKEKEKEKDKDLSCDDSPLKSDYKTNSSKIKYTDEHYEIAVKLSNPVKAETPNAKINLEQWAEDVRKIIEVDKRTPDELIHVWTLRTNDHGNGGSWNGWSKNCRTPAKLRQRKDGLQYFDIIRNQLDLKNRAMNGKPSAQTITNRLDPIEIMRNQKSVGPE